MDWSTNLTFFLAGGVVGLAVALLGGALEYWLNLRPGTPEVPPEVPGCLLYAVGGLAIAGVISLIGSLVLGNGITGALILGAGVLSGFYAGFVLLFGIWLLLNRY